MVAAQKTDTSTSRRRTQRTTNQNIRRSSRSPIRVFRTSLGWMALAASEAGLVRSTFGWSDTRQALQQVSQFADAELSQGGWLDELAERLAGFAQGQPDDFLNVVLDTSRLTPFQRSVIEHCRRTPHGSTLSYGELAARAGSPRAARAVGNIMANNRWALIVPCHRIVASGGSIGGYSAPEGLDMKRRLLALESSST